MGNVNREQLLEYVNALSVAVVETTLFLDTHPDDQEALKYYDRMKMLLYQAKKEYSMRFGPLNNTDVNVSNGWSWVNGPWPWERGC